MKLLPTLFPRLMGHLLLSQLTLLGLISSALGQDGTIDSLRNIASQGDSAAQFDMGNHYLYGDGVEIDAFEAVRWFRMAADQGNNNAQYNLGVMYLQGTGVIADFPTALGWFRKAAEQGDPPAQFTLATLYANGRGVPQDPVQAHMWFTLAASGGHRAAAANLVLYQEMMSTEQVVEAQAMASDWVARFNRMREKQAPAAADLSR